MKISFNIDNKLLASLVVVGIAASSFFYMQPIKAQAITSLSGQYGCILNRNFGGMVLSGGQGTNLDITGSNFMMYFDFSSSPQAQVNVVGLTNWGFDDYATNSLTLASTALSVVSGPLPNSFSVKPVLGGVEVAYNMMAVNGGATLLVQSLGPTPPQSSAEEPPATGVCNKV